MSHDTHLQPDTILQVATETEERIWFQGGITDDKEESLHFNPVEMGHTILQHGGAVREIHTYFTSLEQRKCCLLLAACKQRFCNVRLVRNDGRDSGIEEGAMMKSSLGNTDTVSFLDAVQFQVFQHALRCAAFPVLGAPDPPSGITPSPRTTPTYVPKRRFEGQTMTLSKRALTPASLHDSGVEEQEDTAMVPAETLCELLRRSFRLSQEKFNQYEEIIASQMEKKSPQKILAEELVRQLMALENNENTYYSPKTYINRLGYDQWQQRERSHITELLNKFWNFSLPRPTNRSTEVKLLHNEYKLLMERLIQYESPYRQQSELIAPPPTSPLSSASVRLLQEFGLRYGVGEQYRKIVYLHYLASNFDPTVWFIQHVIMTLTTVMETMPGKRSCLVIVKDEGSMLENSLHLLEMKSSAAMAKMKTLFSDNKPSKGIECLIELLSLTTQAKSYLLMSPEEQLEKKLFKIIQTIFPIAYERHKMVDQDELRQNKWEVELGPKLLNMLIGNIRDEVQDYKQNYQTEFQKYFNITVEAAQVFYRLLMADVSQLHKHSKDAMNTLRINKLMLSLAYRLNQLDRDWSIYVTPQMQTWREVFLLEAQHWSVVLKTNMQQFVTRAVALDRYTSCELQLSGSLYQSSSLRSRRHRTISKSLTPSINSAFSSLSSANSMPALVPGVIHTQPSIPEGNSNQGGKTHRVTTFPVQEDTSHPNDPKSPQNLSDRRPSSDPVNISQSSVLSGSYLGDMARTLGHYDDASLLCFTNLRHSSSLPNMNDNDRHKEIAPKSSLNAQTKKTGISSEAGKPGSAFKPVVRQISHQGNISPEITSILSDPLDKNPVYDTDDTCTLTDDSGSPDGDYNFPPLEEMKSSTPVCNPDIQTVTVISDIAGSSSVVRPMPMGSNQVSSIKNQKSKQASSTEKVLNRQSNHLNQKSFKSNDMTDSHEKNGSQADDKHLYAEGNVYDSFTDSLNSHFTTSIRNTPDHTVALLPISSSAVDVIVILQRIVGFGKALSRTLAPFRVGSDSDTSNLMSSGGSKEGEFHLPPLNSKCRQKMYDNFLSAICSTVCLYADNMLCMDLCGTSQSIARKLAGPRLIQYLQTQQRSGLMWGCRHNLAGNTNCFEYLNKKTHLLCDRHEPITQDMCTRVNNVTAMLSCLDWYHRRLGNVFGILGDLSVRQPRSSLQMSINSTEILRSDFIFVDSYGYDPVYDKSEVMETCSQLCPSLKGGREDNGLVTSPVDTDKDHLMAILRAHCRIMAYRLNVFVRDALPVLLTLKAPNISLDVGLKPVTDFLSSYITTLHGWLYKESFRRVLECLWIFIVQDFEMELGKLERSTEDTEIGSHILLQALSHLLKFMNSQDESLRRELLLSQAEDVSFRLSLYAMPVSQLIAIYRRLNQDVIGTETSSIDTEYQSTLLVRQRLKHDLQTYNKCFSGSDLTRWILENQELFSIFDATQTEGSQPFTRNMAHHIAQRLLEWDLIANIEGDSSREYMGLTTSLDDVDFPSLTVHCQLTGQRDRPFSQQSEIENLVSRATPGLGDKTPRATSRSGLKAGLRALSRQSGVKSATPGLKVTDRSQSQYGLRSEKSYESDNSKLQRSLGAERAELFTKTVPGRSSKQTVTADIHEIPQNNETNLKRVDGDENKVTGAVRQESTNEMNMEVAESFSLDSDLGLNFEYEHFKPKGASADFDPYLERGTPLSMSSCDSTGPVFLESSDTFYYVCPHVGNKLETGMKNYELFQLVEDCFQKKVTPEYIVRILYSRRKYDGKARTFIKAMPAMLVERVKYDMHQEEVPMCVSS